MGALSDPMAVVDDRLKVRNVQRLRVIDASVIPQVVRSKTNAPTMAIGFKSAAMIYYTTGLAIIVDVGLKVLSLSRLYGERMSSIFYTSFLRRHLFSNVHKSGVRNEAPCLIALVHTLGGGSTHM